MKKLMNKWKKRFIKRHVSVAMNQLKNGEISASGLRRLELQLTANEEIKKMMRWDRFAVGEEKLRRGDIDGARQTFRGLAEEEHHLGYRGLTLCALEDGDVVAADQYADRAIETGEERFVPYLQELKWRILLRQGKFQEAKEGAYSQWAALSRYLGLMKNTPNAAHLRFKHVVIVSYGRTGSTLLQGLLNSIDGVLVRGENKSAFLGLWKVHRSLADSMDSHGANSFFANNPWFGIAAVDETQWMKDLQQLVRNFLLGRDECGEHVKCLGFKEVKFHVAGEDLGSYLAFLDQLLPNCCFILNTRRHEDVLKSGFWKKQEHDEAKAKLELTERAFASFAAHRSNCFEVDYKDLHPTSERLRDLFDFLGAPWEQEAADLVFQTPHSYAPEQSHIAKLFER